MDTNRLLFAVLSPLLVANVVLWARYAHSPVMAAVWTLVAIGCWAFLWKR